MASIDTDRFLELFVGSQSQVYGYIAMFLTNRADVEDLFQQTSLVLWKKRDQYDTSREFISWALGIAHNEVRNFIRRKNRGGVLLSEAVIERLAAVRHKAADRIEAGQEVRVPPLPEAPLPEAPQRRTLSPADRRFLEEITLYEDADLLILNKPSGLAVQGGSIVTIGSVSWFAPNVVGPDFNGSVVVSAGQPLVGIGNGSYRSDVDGRYGVKYGDSFTTYNGINK